MKQARTWRIGLRMSVLQQFSTLGRDAGAFQPRGPWRGPVSFGGRTMGLAGALSSRYLSKGGIVNINGISDGLVKQDAGEITQTEERFASNRVVMAPDGLSDFNDALVPPGRRRRSHCR